MKAAELALTEQERSTLQGWMRAGKTERRRHFRARVILELDRGGSNAEVAKRCGTREATISKWRGRFASSRLAGLEDAPRSGKPPRYDEATARRILRALDETPPEGYARWNGRLLARRLKDVSQAQVWRCCASTASRWSGGAAGASAPIPASRRRLPTSSGSICSRRRMRWCCRSTKSLTSRPWSAPRAA